MKFEWDAYKNQVNTHKYGIDFSDGCYLFSDPFALNLTDNEHSKNEERWLLLGKNLNGRVLLVVHIFVSNDRVGTISARKATPNETTAYVKMLAKWKKNMLSLIPNKVNFMWLLKTYSYLFI